MKKLLVVLAILFIGILLAGCTSQPAAPVATPAPTAAPTTVATAAPTVEVTKEAVIVIIEKETATPTATPTAQPSTTITFTVDMTIIPDTYVTIPVGGKVIWKNEDPLKPHGVMATDMQDGAWFGGMSSVTIPYGQTLEVTFDKAGAYDYTTVFQPETKGVIYVK